MQKHLRQYIANELKLNTSEASLLSTPTPLSMPPPVAELKNTNYITMQNKTGWSRYKELHEEHWDAAVNFVHRNTSYKVVQIGGPHDPPLRNADLILNGKNFTTNAAAHAHARLHVGLDSVLNHLSAFSWSSKITPAVIFFGSTSPTGSGYPSSLNVYAGLECQPCYRENPEISAAHGGPCPHDHACIKSLTPEQVCEKIEFKLNNL
jgi:ADP-heptose:LPS heptosyltransferase